VADESSNKANEKKTQDLTQVIGAAAQGLVANASRLGLTWQLHLASVGAVIGEDVYLTIDGDKTTVVGKTMIGPIAPIQRVYVLAIPPGGLFVVGIAGNNRIGCAVARAATQTLPDAGASSTLFQWDTVYYDPYRMWARATPTIITIPVSGIWALSLNSVIGAAVTGRAFTSIIASGRFWRTSMVTGEQFNSCNATIPMNAGEQVTCEQYADMASASNMVGYLACTLVSG
jgi:hypothetical protein